MRGLGIKGPGKAGAGAEAWKAGRAETEGWMPGGWKRGSAEPVLVENSSDELSLGVKG